MTFADDLLEQARHLAKREPRKPKQASLRRAVSTAYYALFHFLISEATRNWKRAGQRHALARFFEHGKMKAASDKQRGECDLFIKANPQPGPHFDSAQHLRRVADVFFRAQQERHMADYDNAKRWTRTDALRQIALVDAAFQSWHVIRDEPSAQAYLISLLGRSQGHG